MTVYWVEITFWQANIKINNMLISNRAFVLLNLLNPLHAAPTLFIRKMI